MKTDIQEQVLNLIPKKREDAITSKELMNFTGLSFRELKKNYIRTANHLSNMFKRNRWRRILVGRR